MHDYATIDAAFRRVSEGYVAPAANTHEGAAELWCRIAARGRVVSRHDDGGTSRAYRVHLTIVEHPELPAGQVYALYGMGQGAISVYRCTADDARLALRHNGAFNL